MGTKDFSDFITAIPILILLLTQPTNPCFVIHYVTYFQPLPNLYYLPISQSSPYPYTVHLNEPLNLPNNRTFTREITPVEMSDIKKVEVIYHHGGLYLDNDQFIDYQCVKKILCGVKGLFFLDWMEKPRWRASVPLSFIYASEPGNQTLRLSLEGLNQSKEGDKGPRTVYFSGPSHMQQYRSGMQFIKIPKSCQRHRADRSWIPNKPPNELAHDEQILKKTLQKYSKSQIQAKQKFLQLWSTHTVIYPKNFNITTQDRIEEEYNHVEMIDTVEVRVRVIRYATVGTARGLLEEFLRKYAGGVKGDEEGKEGIDVAKVSGGKSANQPKVTEVRSDKTNKSLTEPENLTIIKQNNHSTQTPKITLNSNKTVTNTPIPTSTPNSTNSSTQTPSTPSTHPTKPSPQSQPTLNKTILTFLNTNFYSLTILLLLTVLGICYFCYHHTNCCKNNNYERNFSDRVRNRMVLAEKSGSDLEEEDFGGDPASLAELAESTKENVVTETAEEYEIQQKEIHHQSELSEPNPNN